VSLCQEIRREKKKEKKEEKEDEEPVLRIYPARGHSHCSDLYMGLSIDLLPHSDSVSSTW
jgi:hypothetical protein